MPLLLVNATDLNEWARRRDAQATLPQVLRRLALATDDAIHHIAFRSGEGVQIGGWDGIVQTNSGNAFVPSGSSGWESGCDGDIKGKADDDYAKRTTEPLGVEHALTTFVFVTPRRWREKQKWAAARREEGVWKDVVAYDADDLATWLELAPAVHIWLSALLGKHPSGAEDLLSFWRTWSTVTKPALSEEFVLAGRTHEVQRVQDWVSAQPGALAIQGDTEDEAISFFAAAVQRMPDADRERHHARTILVRDASVWLALATVKAGLLLIPTFVDRSRVASAVGDGHHVLIPLARDEPLVRGTIELSRPRRDDASVALQAMGLTKEHASALAPVARASLGALRRALAVNPVGLTARWAASASGRDVIPALLAGRWNEASEADRNIVSKLAQRSYADYRDILTRLAREPDPPVRQIGSVWTMSAKDDAWALLATFVTDRDLERLEAAVDEALGELDPKFDLAPDQRWHAALHGKVLNHSAIQREALADTVALVASTSTVFPLKTTRTGQETANRVVHAALASAMTWQHWASRSAQLRSLAEAAPDVFLDAVEAALVGEAPLLRDLFVDGDPLFCSSPHTDLLWALELLAWAPEHLRRVALVLAKLARIDPGGKLANRPASSLHHIFLPWHPGTAASVERRVRVLDTIRKREPDAAWELLSGLVTTRMGGVAMPTARPRRRDWVPAERTAVRVADYHMTVKVILERLRVDAGSNGARWKVLIESLSDLPDDELELTLDALASVHVEALAQQDRLAIWSSLRVLLSRHREFADAGWSLAPERLRRLDALYDEFEPEDVFDRMGWLFNSKPEPPKCEAKGWRERHAAVASLQIEAVERLVADSLAPAFELSARVEHPHTIGFALGQSSVPDTLDRDVLDRAIGSPHDPWRELGRGFLHGRWSRNGVAWLSSVRCTEMWAAWSPEQQAEYFEVLPFCAETWDLFTLGDMAVERLYWTKVSPFARGEVKGEDRDRAARALMQHGRPAAAVRLLALYSRGANKPVDGSMIIELLDRLVSGPMTEADESWGRLGYEISELLDIASGSENVSEERVARLEWVLLPLLKHDRPPKVLHKALSNDPALFVEVLKLVYKGRNEPPKEVAPDARHRANLGYDLLHDWKLPPGMHQDGSFDAAALTDWVTRARELAATADRSAMAEQEIGRVLAHVPTGADGVWPHEGVRELLEQIASDRIEQGIAIGVYNNRGVVSRNMGEGGAQERELEDRYRRFADGLADEWPRSSRLLKRIAEDYNSEARGEDVRADLDEELWG